MLGTDDVGATFPHRVTMHPTCHSLRLLHVGDRAAAAARARARHRPGRPARRPRVLRLRRHVRDQERRRLDGDALRQAAPHPRHARRGLHGGRQLLPDAHRRRPAPPARGRARRCTWPRSWRPRERRLPSGGARGARQRPAAAQPGQGDDDDPGQARQRRRRSCPTGRRCARPARRSRRARWRRCPSSSSASRRRSRARAARCTGRATRPRPTRIVASIARAHGAREVIKVKSIATDEIELNAALEAQGITAIETDLAELIIQLADDTLVAHPRAGDPPQPGRDQDLFERTIARGQDLGWEASGDRRGRAARTCARSSSACRSPCRGANFGVAETGTVGRRRVRGQRAHVHDAARGADHASWGSRRSCPSGATSRSSCSCCRAPRPASG